jgi:hypothetical protein
MRLQFAISIAMMGLLGVATTAKAQRGFGGKPAPARRVSAGMRSGGFRPAHQFRSRFPRREAGYGSGWGWAYLPFPDDYDYYGSEYYDDDGDNYLRTTTRGAISERSAEPTMPAVPEREIQPVLIERQGDRWVQVTGYSASAPVAQGGTGASEIARPIPGSPAGGQASESHYQTPAAVLVFRDGHEEEVKSYTIIGEALYAKVDFWVDGSWTRKIEIANLDVPATLKLNQERGSQFRLPSGPQEVMIRP